MNLDTVIHFALAMAESTMAVLLWHRAMPRIKAARGQWQSMCIWLLGLGLAFLAQATFARGWVGAPVHWYFVMGDLTIAPTPGAACATHFP